MDDHGWSVPAVVDATGNIVADIAVSEDEMREFLTALVRVLKPDLVVETGTYKGHGARALGLGAYRNGAGRVVTCDTDLRHQVEARNAVAGLPVEIRYVRGIDLPELPLADLVFCDSDYGAREAEIGACKLGAVVVVHDTLISYDSSVARLAGVVLRHSGLCFATHRGFGVIVR